MPVIGVNRGEEMSVHVLITGGAGFIGSHTVERVLDLGATVRVFDNLSSGKLTNLPNRPGLQTVNEDIRDLPAVEQAFDGISHVLHLAAQVSVSASIEDPLASSGTNVGGFLNVLDTARRRDVARFVYASSSAVYGAPGADPSSETTAAKPISPYGMDKLLNDSYADLYGRLYGLSCLGLRYFNVFGTRQDASSPYSGVISIFMRSLRRREPLTIFGDGQQTRDFVYVEDVANVNALALSARLEGVCNVATGTTVSLLELTEMLGETVGRTPEIQMLAERAGDIRHSSADNARLCAAFALPGFTSVAAGLERLWRATDCPI